MLAKKRLPLKYRIPQAELEAEAQAREEGLSPQDVYWDSRYKSYFYAGELPQELVPGAPAKTRSVEIEPSSPDPDEQSTASILVTGDRPRSWRPGHRISWGRKPKEPIYVETREPRQRREPMEDDTCCCLSVCCCCVVALIMISGIVGLWALLRQGIFDRSTTPEDIFLGLELDDLGVRRGYGESEGDSPSNPGLSNDSYTATPFDIDEALMRFETVTEDFKLASDICLYTHKGQEWDLLKTNETDPLLQGHSAARSCDVRLHCCYSLQEDMSVSTEDWPQRHARRLPHIQYAVIRAKYATFQKLLTNQNGSVNAFIYNVLGLVQARGYLGFRVSLGELKIGDIEPVFIHAVREIAGRLHKRNLTLGFFLPFGDPMKAVFVKRLGFLAKALAAPQSLLLYPTASVLMNRGVLQPVVFPESTSTTPSVSVCYLFYSAPAILVVLGNATRCDVTGTQLVFDAMTLRLGSLDSLCHSWKPSWNVSVHPYHGYVCTGEREGAVFQTPLQALKFRHALLSRSRSSCFGFLDDEQRVLRACRNLKDVLRDS